MASVWLVCLQLEWHLCCWYFDSCDIHHVRRHTFLYQHALSFCSLIKIIILIQPGLCNPHYPSVGDLDTPILILHSTGSYVPLSLQFHEFLCNRSPLYRIVLNTWTANIFPVRLCPQHFDSWDLSSIRHVVVLY